MGVRLPIQSLEDPGCDIRQLNPLGTDLLQKNLAFGTVMFQNVHLGLSKTYEPLELSPS